MRSRSSRCVLRLEASSEAAVDLTVPGSEPVRVTIEVVDVRNDSKGYVLREALVAPGKYRLYWDGIDQNSIQPKRHGLGWLGFLHVPPDDQQDRRALRR